MSQEDLAPDKKLANEIVEELRKGGFVDDVTQEIIRVKIESGAATEEDWRKLASLSNSESIELEVKPNAE